MEVSRLEWFERVWGGGYIVVVQRFYWRAKAIGHGLSAIRVYDQDFDGWHGC